MNKEMKQQLFKQIQNLSKELSDSNKKELFCDDSKGYKGNKIGCNQFRSLADNCRVADCYEEIELLVEYKIAKSSENKEWQSNCSNGKSFGKIILDYMKEVQKISAENVMENLQYFFGYLYWQTRIWAANSNSQSTLPNGNRGNNNSNDRNGRYNNQHRR